MRWESNRFGMVQIQVYLNPYDAPHFFVKKDPQLVDEISIEIAFTLVPFRKLVQSRGCARLVYILGSARDLIAFTLRKVGPIQKWLLNLQLPIRMVACHTVRFWASVKNMLPLGPLRCSSDLLVVGGHI